MEFTFKWQKARNNPQIIQFTCVIHNLETNRAGEGREVAVGKWHCSAEGGQGRTL